MVIKLMADGVQKGKGCGSAMFGFQQDGCDWETENALCDEYALWMESYSRFSVT